VTEFVQFTVSGIAAGSLYAIVALGLVLLYRGTRVLSFAHAGFGALGAFVFWTLYPSHVWLPLAFAAAVAAGAAAGVATERLVARPLSGSPVLTLAVATLAVEEILRFGITRLWGVEARTVPPLVTTPVLVVGRIVVPAQRLLVLGVTVAVAAGLAVFLRRSLLGVAVRAAAEDLTAVRLRGVPAGAVTTVVWGVSAALAVVAGVLVSPFLGLSPYFMTLVLLRAFAGAILGGLTSLGGAMAGGILVGVLEAHIQAHTSYPGAVEAALFVVVVAVLLLRPQGLFGSPEAEAAAPLRARRRARSWRLPLPRLSPARGRAVAVTCAAVVAAVFLAAGEYYAFVGALAATYAVVGVSMYLLSGLGGQLSLGHAALMGVGGFTAGLLTTRAGLPYLLALPVAGLAAAAVAVALGLPSFRIRGLYLAVSTLAFGFAAERFVFRLDGVSGGAQGLALPLMPARTVLVVALVLLAGSVVLARRVTRSRAGRALLVLHHDETLAESWGIAANRFKLGAFALSGLLAGLAGVAYATLIGQVTSEAFTAELSVTLVAMAIVGGLGSVPGVVAGSVLFAVLPEVLRGATLYLPLASASILLAVILFLPRGMAELWRTP
jgi:branched-chain amino acid transport system permease protein